MSDGSITYQAAETALCIWEWMIEQRAAIAWLPDTGAYAHRRLAIELAEPMNTAFDYAVESYGYDDAFDWEFVPRVLAAITDVGAFEFDPCAVVDSILEVQS
jgi:hypothetical protein